MLPRPIVPGIPFQAPSRVRATVTVALLALLSLASADAVPSLYGPEAPQDVAFLRAVNASPSPVAVRVGDGEERELAPGEATDYRALSPDEASFAWTPPEGEARTVPAEAAPESFLTLLVDGSDARVLEDEVLRDISRGLLVFVNAADAGPLTLRLADGTEVFAEVGDEPVSMTIAEGDAAFEVTDASGEVLASLDARTLERGSAHTLLAFEGPEGFTLAHLEAALAD